MMRLMWHQHSQDEDWGFIPIDVRSAFNEENRAVILWAVRHDWPSGSYFTFKCCCHWDTLVIRDGGGMRHFVYRKSGVSQGYPLTMIAYVIKFYL